MLELLRAPGTEKTRGLHFLCGIGVFRPGDRLKLVSSRDAHMDGKLIHPMSNLTHLSDLDMLDAAIAESLERPVLLFKHSRTCGISAEALDELHAHVAENGGKASYKVITVQSHRRLSDSAAERFGIRHETPQAILLRDGRPVWNASHFRITAATLGQIIQ
jgi:bacillithiol system protein YtxJ